MIQDNQQAINFSSLLASSVHDIKNTLTSIIHHINEIAAELESTSLHAHTQTLNSETRNLNLQLVSLLTLYKIEHKQYFINIDEVDVHHFLNKAIHPYTETLHLKNIELTLRCDEDLVGYFDETLMSGVIGNIMNNALRYTKDNILIEANEEDNGMLCIAISDNGPGYPSSMLNNASPETPISFSNGNTGLGLYFSKTITGLHKNKGRHGMVIIDNHGISNGGRCQIQLP